MHYACTSFDEELRSTTSAGLLSLHVENSHSKESHIPNVKSYYVYQSKSIVHEYFMSVFTFWYTVCLHLWEKLFTRALHVTRILVSFDTTCGKIKFSLNSFCKVHNNKIDTMFYCWIHFKVYILWVYSSLQVIIFHILQYVADFSHIR